MNSVYRITEYSSFIPDKCVPGYVTLPKRTFEQLEDFLLLHNGDGLEFLKLSARRGIGKIITARQYVGVIAMKDGITLEILPKTYDSSGDENQQERARALLLDMLRTLRLPPYKSLHAAHLDAEKMTLFEIFISMFVKEVFRIVKQGLGHTYEAVEENLRFFRGKMKFSRQISLNYLHRERCFAEHDEFTVNRPENRILKTTLLRLYACSLSSRNRTDIKTLLRHFSDIEPSPDAAADFALFTPDRNMKGYADALAWCRIFLAGESFTPFSGAEVALALLFPMDTLFESYVSALLKKHLPADKYKVSLQKSSRFLFDTPGKAFSLRPDIMVTRISDNAVFVLDTKWKRLDAEKPHCGVSQGDMYQMFVYQKKYDARKVLLLYPATESTPSESVRFTSADGTWVQLQFLDLSRMQDSLALLKQELKA